MSNTTKVAVVLDPGGVNPTDSVLDYGSLAAAMAGTNASPTSVGGYATGAGGAVTQGVSKATGVTLSTPTGKITLNGAALASDTAVSFTWTNTLALATDIVIIEHVSGGTAGAYNIACFPGAGANTVTVQNVTAGSLSEAIVLRFKIERSADA